MTRYDLSQGTYKPSIALARAADGEGYYEGLQWGDLVAVHGGRIGVRWETKAPRNENGVIESGFTFEVLPAALLPGFVEEAAAMLQPVGPRGGGRARRRAQLPAAHGLVASGPLPLA